jgi:hypothetical protein
MKRFTIIELTLLLGGLHSREPTAAIGDEMGSRLRLAISPHARANCDPV